MTPSIMFAPRTVVAEELVQLHLLNQFRQGSDPEVDDLKRWLSSRDGEHGWRVDL